MTTPLFPSFLPAPEQDGYGVDRGTESVSIQLDGGPARVRQDSLGMPSEVRVSWTVDETEYAALIGFFRERVQKRTRFFRIPLIIDTPSLVNYLARVIGKPERLASTKGLTFEVQATLEVLPNPIRSYSLSLQSVSDDRVIDGGSSDYAGDLSEFPIGRQVLLTGCQGVVDGVSLDLDGTYTINGAPTVGIITLASAPVVNADWTALRATTSKIMAPTFAKGACILLPL